MKENTQASLYPALDANRTLLSNLTQILGSLSVVHQVYGFGSFVRREADRWSDIDLLVVTEEREQFGAVFETLETSKPIIYRSAFTPRVEPSGGRVLGIVFEGESVFHSLDLNFMTTAEFATAGALERLGMMEVCNVIPTSSNALRVSTLVEDFEPDDKKRVADGLHFVKKTLKQRLRGAGSNNNLAQWHAFLQDVLEQFTPVPDNPRGDIATVALAYANMAAAWLASC